MPDPCKHSKFKHEVSTAWVNLGEMRQLFLCLKLKCVACGLLFTFAGHEGLSTDGPTVSEGGTELRAPIFYPELPDVADPKPPVH